MKSWRNPHIVSFSDVVVDFRSGRQTPRDFLERCIARVEKSESQLQAFVTLDLDAARKAADASTRRYRDGKPLSPVDGCPVGFKDIMSTRDLPTQMGSPAFKGWLSQQDAAC
ncbi:MAG: amidase family protein, partial [Burkholderiales bacterium]